MLYGKRILIIDDSDTIRAYLQSVLTQKGALEVDGADTGHEGLTMCTRRPYDLVLLDLFLPDIDGIEVLKNIRSVNNTTTVVMITGYGGIKSAIAAVQLGADGYIEKQDITSSLRDHLDFLYALDQAIEHRAGLIAQKQLEQIRADFYAMVTHDLRNPTSLILMAAEMLSNESAEAPQQELIHLIEEGAKKLIRLINDYLDFAKIDAGYLRLDLGQIDMIQVVESSTRFAHLQAQVKQQTLIVDVPPEPVLAWVDAERLKQVLDNLLSNAIKYTPPGGQIKLRLGVEVEHAVLSISDTGGGIPLEHLARLFTKYHRIPGDATHTIWGTGLGLLIVKEIVEAHRGTVQAVSEGIAGKGSTFIVRIPLRQQNPGEQPVQVDGLPKTELDKTTGDPDFHRLFWLETQRHLLVLQDALEGSRLIAGDRRLLDRACQASHTLKGNAGAMQMKPLYELVVQLDDVLQQAGQGTVTLTQTHLEALNHLLGRIASMAAREQTP